MRNVTWNAQDDFDMSGYGDLGGGGFGGFGGGGMGGGMVRNVALSYSINYRARPRERLNRFWDVHVSRARDDGWVGWAQDGPDSDDDDDDDLPGLEDSGAPAEVR